MKISALSAALVLIMAALPAEAAKAEDYTVGHAKGSADAPITLVEYGSLSCGTCKYFHDKIMPTIEEDYVATGKVRFVFREVLHNDIDTALVSIARCAGDGEFFEVVDTIFEMQPDIISAAREGRVTDKFIEIGSPYGITDMDKFDACYRDMDIRFDILEVTESAKAYELHGTPTLIVNGEEKYLDNDFASGEAFAAYLDRQLDMVSGVTAPLAE